MLRRLSLLAALVWASFVAFIVFASFGDTSLLHIGAHVVQLPLIGAATVLAWWVRPEAVKRAQKVMLWIISVTTPLAFLGIAGELVTAVVRFGEDGWENKDTADIWVDGPHAIIANITVPALFLSMLTVLVLLLTIAVQERRRPSVA